MNIVFILIPGIRTNGNDLSAWTDLGVSWLNINTKHKAEKFEYHCGALDRFIGQRKRTDVLSSIIEDYKNKHYKVILIGHSNGTDIIARILGLNKKIDSAHLISPAAYEEDYYKAFEKELINKVFIYGSNTDEALLLSKFSKVITRFFSKISQFFGGPRLGYGTMGLRGKEVEEKYPLIVKDCSINGYRHSTWINEYHLYSTLKLILNNERLK